jgi:hypothetical protein
MLLNVCKILASLLDETPRQILVLPCALTRGHSHLVTLVEPLFSVFFLSLLMVMKVITGCFMLKCLMSELVAFVVGLLL